MQQQLPSATAQYYNVLFERNVNFRVTLTKAKNKNNQKKCFLIWLKGKQNFSEVGSIALLGCEAITICNQDNSTQFCVASCD